MVSTFHAGNCYEVLSNWTIARHVDQVPEAHRQVRRLAETVPGLGTRAYEVEVCASETIGNAVLHGRGDKIGILVCADDTGITVEVWDDGSGNLPEQRQGADETGRGLLIVSALADRWGYLIDDETAQLCVSFDFDITPSAGPDGRP